MGFAIGAVGDKKGAYKSKGSEAAGMSPAAPPDPAPQGVSGGGGARGSEATPPQRKQGRQASHTDTEGSQSRGIDTQDKVNGVGRVGKSGRRKQSRGIDTQDKVNISKEARGKE